MPRLKKLTKAQRARLPKSDFVFPERAPAVGSYPINVKARAMVAIQLAQLSAKGRRDLPKVKKAVFARYPSLIAWWNKNHPDKKWRGKRPQRARTYRRREEIDLAANPKAEDMYQMERDDYQLWVKLSPEERKDVRMREFNLRLSEGDYEDEMMEDLDWLLGKPIIRDDELEGHFMGPIEEEIERKQLGGMLLGEPEPRGYRQREVARGSRWRERQKRRSNPSRRRKIAANPATRKQIADKIAQLEADEGNRYGWTRRWKKSFAAMSLGEDPNAWPSFGADDGPLDWSGDRWLVGRDWDDEDFAEVYAHFEGELPPTTHPRERGNPRSNIGEGYASEEEWEEFREYIPAKSKKKKKTKKKAKSRGFKAGKQEAISTAKTELRAKYRNKDKNWFNKMKTSERFQEEWIEIRRKIVKRYTR